MPSATFLQPVADTEWFATQPQFWVNAQGFQDLFGWPAIHAPQAQAHLFWTELAYFALQCWGAYHALFKRKDFGVWLGMALLGAQMEFIGVAITHSHKQSQMMVQVMPFLPLKEILWYPMTQYPCYLLCQHLNLSRYGRATCAALLHSFQVIQYESMAYREGVNYLVANPDFLLANTGDLIGGGPWMNIYGNFAICFVAVTLANTERLLNPFALMLAFGLFDVTVIGFYPMNLCKLLGCVLGGVALFPDKDAGWFSLQTWVDAYSHMMKQSPVLENLVVKAILLFSTAYAAHACSSNKAKSTAAGVVLDRADLYFCLGNIAAYHVLLGAVVYWCDVQVERGEALSIWTTCALAASLLTAFYVAQINAHGGKQKKQ